MSNSKNAWALVTGASGGIGRDMSVLLAQRGYDLIVVARSQDKLNELASQLQAAHGIRVRVIAQDLGQAGSVAQLMNRIGTDVADIEVLINNAGFGLNGQFDQTPADRLTEMVQLNVTSLMDLTRAVLPSLKARGKGYIMNVASAVAFQPCPNFAVYGATKAFVLSFSQALHLELSGTGVSVTAVCPGSTATDFHQVSGSDRTLVAKLMDSSQSVAQSGLNALFARRSSVVTGLLNKPLPFVNRLVPRMWMAALVGVMFSSSQRKDG
jgi:short-subunit dehydrogenase